LRLLFRVLLLQALVEAMDGVRANVNEILLDRLLKGRLQGRRRVGGESLLAL